MARSYAKVLRALCQPFRVVGRGAQTAHTFEGDTGQAVSRGGLELVLGRERAPELAIVAVGVEQLAPAAASLVRGGTRRILLEKPGGVDAAEIASLHALAETHGAQVLLGYNRRFYGSTRSARHRIEEDGGLVSARFEFTEWAHKVERSSSTPRVKERWMLANSSHPVDLAFFFCGLPIEWRGWHAGSLDWHSSAARFCGAGVTTQGVLFSYLADWQAPGRWGLELLTRERRLVLAPLEQLGAVGYADENVEYGYCEDELDREYKAGLYRQTKAFLSGDDRDFCTLSRQVINAGLLSEMAGYK